MGNATAYISQRAASALKQHEYSSGKKLLAGIKSNSRSQIDEAVEYAKNEFAQPISSSTANSADYDYMTSCIVKYLTKGYDVGDGPLFLQTPLEFCKTTGSNEAASAIKQHLMRFGINVNTDGNSGEGSQTIKDQVIGVESINIGIITHERAELAKEKLHEFQSKK